MSERSDDCGPRTAGSRPVRFVVVMDMADTQDKDSERQRRKEGLVQLRARQGKVGGIDDESAGPGLCWD